VAISDTIDISVTGIGEVDALASALDQAAESLARIDELAGKGLDFGAAGAGADKLAASYEAAFGKIQAGADKVAESLAKVGDIGGGADAGAASLGKLDDSLKGVQEQADAVTASVGKADDSLKALGDTADTAAAAGLGKAADSAKGLDETLAGAGAGADKLGAGLKGLGDTGDGMAAQVAAWRAEMASLNAETDKMLAKSDALSLRAPVTAASAASLNEKVAASGYLGTSSVEDDAAAVKASRLQAEASADSAAAAQAEQKSHEMLLLGGAAALGYGIDLAAKLQTSVTRLYTTAGESAANLPMMTAGILALSGQTNTSQAQLGQGAYMIESAGYHGQNALGVLKAAAEGAQAEGAPLGDTANALTSLMNAYGVPKGQSASQAAMSDMDQIIAMVSRGKMTMASAVSALPNVLPAASAAHLSFADVGGALSTMTAMGVSPDRAAMNLSHVITSIMNPNATQTKEQQQLGLNPVQIQNDLGKQGLTGTLTELSDTVMKNMGPAGDVLFKTFNQSKSAAADAQTMISAMPSSIRGVAQAYADGTVSAAQWNQEMFKGSESAQQKNMLQQFATVENQAKGFNDLLKTGAPDVQTYAAAMDKLLGGQTGLNVAMELTGQHMPVMKANTDAIAASAQHAGDNVTGWAKVQSTLNFQLGSFGKEAQAVATEAGQVALPALTGLLHGASDATGFLASNPALAKDLMIGGGALAIPALLAKVASPIATGLSGVGKVAETLHIPGLDKLANIGQNTGLNGAAGDLSGSAGRLSAAAGDLSAAAGKLGESGGVPGGGPGGTAERETEELAEQDATEAAAAGWFTKLAGKGGATAGLSEAFGPLLQGLTLGLIAKGIGDQIAPAGTQAGKYNQMLQSTKGLDTSGLMPYILGGFEGKMMGSFGEEAGKVIQRGLSQASQMVTDPLGAIAGSGSMLSRLGITPAMAAAAQAAPARIAPAASAGDLLGGAGHPGTVTIKADTSGLDSAKGKVTSDLAGITAAIAAAMGKPAKVPGPDLSLLAAAKGPATADGSAVASGFAAGIASGAGAVSAAAGALASDAVAALTSRLQSHSPSEVTKKTGADFDTGFGDGITANSGGVVTAAGNIGSSTVSSLVQGLLGGQSNIQDATTAILGQLANPDAVSTIQQTIQTLQSDVSGDSGLVKWLGGQEAKLDALANRQGQLTTEITDAQQLATSAISGASITSAAGYSPALSASYGPQSAQETLTGMQQQAADTKQFAAQLAQLQKEGLNATSISQLAQAGTATGLPIAAGLTQGGAGIIKQLNAAESQIIKSSQQIGTVGGQAMYQAGIAVTDGLATSLKTQLAKLDAEMTKEANAVIKAVSGHAGSSSSSAAPAGSSSSSLAALASGASGGSSKAGADLSGLGHLDSAAGSAASGLGSVASAAGSAASGLGRIAALFAPAQHGGAAAGGHGGGTTIINQYTVTVTVQGNVSTERDLADAVSEHLIEKSANNWQVAQPVRQGY
jgi:hypothetical protein